MRDRLALGHLIFLWEDWRNGKRGLVDLAERNALLVRQTQAVVVLRQGRHDLAASAADLDADRAKGRLDRDVLAAEFRTIDPSAADAEGGGFGKNGVLNRATAVFGRQTGQNHARPAIKWQVGMWLCSACIFAPVWIVVTRVSKNLIFDGMLFDNLLFLSLAATLVFLGAARGFAVHQWVGLGLVVAGAVLMRI